MRFIVVLLSLLITAGSLHAQTATPPPNPATLTLIVERDSLTLYVPDASISLVNFGFRVNGVTYRLDEFPAFAGLTFDALPAPLCLRLEYGNNTVPPLRCQSIRTFTQPLASVDVFWFDNVELTVEIVGGIGDEIFCGSGNRQCNFLYVAPLVTITSTLEITPRATSTILPIGTSTVTTKTYPCPATIISTDLANIINILYIRPNIGQPSGIQVGTPVTVVEAPERISGTLWYPLLELSTNRFLGYVRGINLALSNRCPNSQ